MIKIILLALLFAGCNFDEQGVSADFQHSNDAGQDKDIGIILPDAQEPDVRIIIVEKPEKKKSKGKN